MGCDIHAYIEYWAASSPDHVGCFLGPIGTRNYALFGHLAGVRYVPSCGPVCAPRGLPEGALSYRVRWDVYLSVVDDVSPDDDDDNRVCSLKQARAWGQKIFVGPNGQSWTIHPDTHSHSWLTPDELAQAIGRYIVHDGEYPYAIEWDAMLAAMRAFEERGYQARLTFWFDN